MSRYRRRPTRESRTTGTFAGQPGGLTRDDVLDNITLTWLTNTAISSARTSVNRTTYEQIRSKCPLSNTFRARSEGYRSWPCRTHNPKVRNTASRDLRERTVWVAHRRGGMAERARLGDV
ncbi:MAG: hypothetical protein DME05_14220 [Candidatus Rokuibacteriota bacterium]|nr:MAG: hypothetical protein DME05_14220 [Candidatus Rokubacteria bacterium]